MVPDEIFTLEESVDAFNMARDQESEALFDQSDIAARTCIERNRAAWGLTDEDILEHIGKQTETSRTTMYGRLLVGKVFPRHWREDVRNAWCKRKRWTHFEVAARTWSEEDPDAPAVWLEYCVANDLSVRELHREIKLAGGERPDPSRAVYLLRAEEVTVSDICPTSLTVTFDIPLAVPLKIAQGDRVVIDVVKEAEPREMPEEEEPDKVPA